MNENYAQPSLPEDAREKVVRGCYRFGHYAAIDQAKPDAVAADDAARTPRAAQDRVALLGSGAILPEALKAAERLARMGIASDVSSVTSWSELDRDGQTCEAGELRGQAKRSIERRVGEECASTCGSRWSRCD